MNEYGMGNNTGSLMNEGTVLNTGTTPITDRLINSITSNQNNLNEQQQNNMINNRFLSNDRYQSVTLYLRVTGHDSTVTAKKQINVKIQGSTQYS